MENIFEKVISPKKTALVSLEEDKKLEEKVNIITEYLSNMVVNETMDQFLDETCNEEELKQQRSLLIKGIESIIASQTIEKVHELITYMDALEKEAPKVIGIIAPMPIKGTLDCVEKLKKREEIIFQVDN